MAGSWLTVLKFSRVTLVLMGAFILTMMMNFLVLPVLAQEPTATPTSDQGDIEQTACRLAVGQRCYFDNRAKQDSPEALILHVNPQLGAQGVPTYTLVSVTFGRDMDIGTINADTFFVSQGQRRVEGTVGYIPVSRVAVFYPETPLQANTTYTVNVSPDIQDVAGNQLLEETIWSFTTFSGPFQLDDTLTTIGDSSAAGMQVYFGDLHSHTGYAGGQGTPADAFATARANGLHFLAVTDHDIWLSPGEWQDTLVQANLATVGGQFVGLRGFEFTHAMGHLNALATDTFVRCDDPDYNTLAKFYAWLEKQPTAIAQFNHPYPGFNFNNFLYDGTADHKIVLREILSVDQTLLSLNQGWHLGTLLNSDTHIMNWGAQRYMGLVASALTKDGLLEAIRARRTFYVSPSGQNVALVMRANGYWMGSAIPETSTINFSITVYDPNADGAMLKLALYDNGVRVANTSLPTNSGTDSYTWTPTISGRLGHYYYAEATYDGWLYPAYCSPIWVERSPIAEAGRDQIVAPGTLVTLDGSSSWDADGDILAYRWTREGGPQVTLSQNNAAQVTFTAPVTLGQAVFRLLVTDPGSLSDDDTTGVTITDQPILAISKSGPQIVGPGDPITYTLSVSNSGISAATGVVVTDSIPAGANYGGGGTLMSGKSPGRCQVWLRTVAWLS